ncbi:GNAT family N-acetyltransferase [Desulfovibrio sp. OttesenSCG-928-C06]|nr:GNAT family N-acetyltransferase [Desulfovibrio sp. OttesenSCG-928-C06]
MSIRTAIDRTGELINELLTMWEASVRATHSFLTDDDIISIKPYAEQGFIGISNLVYTVDETGSISGFMGIENGKIEMLFIHPPHRGTGLGKNFIHHALDVYKVQFVDVNEQNSQAVGFYRHMGFEIVSRSPLDDAGRPFPILHMKK